ncbi:MAG: hypothetical protein M1823_000116 [Watsoniomyces obsoletus]|nr:MAG: hypothetical protein M1823_000116 [Watsoniomyces obsoletus]
MALRIPRPSLFATDQLQICTRPARNQRSFSTTPVVRVIAPESPRFIPVPQPLQPKYPPRPHVKGFLPVPREIFTARSPDKTTPEYLNATTPEPPAPTTPTSTRAQTLNAGGAAQVARSEWKRRLASIRRRNLRESLVELHARKQRTERATAARNAKRAAERNEAVYRKQAEDERLTAPSVPQWMRRVRVGPVPDPDREARLEQKRANVRALHEEYRAKRLDTLHTLYVHARKFITTEGDLQKEIEAVFVHTPQQWAGLAPGENIWNAGPPSTVREMLSSQTRKGMSEVDQSSQGQSTLHEQRLQEIAAELTGGKIVKEW